MVGKRKQRYKTKIKTRRQQTIKKLKSHRSLIQEMKQIQERNESDAMFLPLLEEDIKRIRT
jgi:hypothetical protein